jgi:hypothetical protein
MTVARTATAEAVGMARTAATEAVGKAGAAKTKRTVYTLASIHVGSEANPTGMLRN